MVLIFDDNEFRRKELKRALRDTEINFKIDTYENWEYLTKPILTVFIMPKPSEIDYLVRSISSQGTVAVSLLKREPAKTGTFRRNILSEDGMLTADVIRDIIKNEYGYNLKQDFVGNALIDEEDNDIYFARKRLFLTKTEYKIARFLAYNPQKTFTDEEILEYTGLKISPSSISKYVSYINHKCKENYRKPLILRTSYGYCINKEKDVVTSSLT